MLDKIGGGMYLSTYSFSKVFLHLFIWFTSYKIYITLSIFYTRSLNIDEGSS